MAMEYVTKSKVALKDVAEMLSRGDTVSQVCVIVLLIYLLTKFLGQTYNCSQHY